MREWIKAEITELELRCTENGRDLTPYQDEVRQENPDLNWYSFSSITD
jgi:hypothetical protein